MSVAAYFGLKQGPAPPAPPPPLTTAQVLAKVQPSVVTVNVQVFRSGKAYGSGFVYGSTGYVLTNAHVVDQAVGITVTDSAGSAHTATLIGVNRATDVAELQVADLVGEPLTATTQAPAPGLPVLVLGNPYGALPNSVAQGIVSAVGRNLTVGKVSYSNLIQTDAVVDPGNSGGPLINPRGQVLGMVTLGGSSRFAFAIPHEALDSEAKTWRLGGTAIALTPPLVHADPSTLVLQLTDFSAGYAVSQAATGSTVAGEYHTAFDNGISSASYDVYRSVLSQVFVDSSFESASGQLSSSEHVISTQFAGQPVEAVSSLADGGEMYLVSGQSINVTYYLTWRDRNVVGLVAITGVRGIVKASEALQWAQLVESRVGADLST